MKYNTAGNKIEEMEICPYCQQNTAGNHEWDCPNRIVAEQLKDKEWQKVLIQKGENKLYGNRKDWQKNKPLKCLNCGRRLKEVEDKIAKKKTGHIYECDCMPKDSQISIG